MRLGNVDKKTESFGHRGWISFGDHFNRAVTVINNGVVYLQ